ncbi:MAG: putative Ig domain-containing protein, partial [Verrucomicrobiales bacterium]|nr:putative Ig domain-containing protein [Verrucomicrobiales bacterium]
DDQFGNDTLLTTIANPTPLAVDAFYDGAATVALSETLAAGQYWIFVQTDALSQVDEPAAENNNTARTTAALAVTAAPVANLAVAQITAPPSGVIGQPISITWTVRNDGGAEARSPWLDRIYLSPNNSVSGATAIGSFLRDENLAPASNYSRTESVTLPTVVDGNYFIIVSTDQAGQVFERDGEINNTLASTNAMAITHPDLVIDAVTAPATAQSDAEIDVTWTGRNAGTGAVVGSWVDRAYLSADDAFSLGDVLLGELARNAALNPAQTYNGTLRVLLPKGVEGNFRVLIVSDASEQVLEGAGEGNNAAASAVIAVALQPYAELEVTSVTAQPLLVGDPVDLTVSWVVVNRGTGAGAVDSWVDRVVLSTDATLGNGDDRLLGEFAHTGLVPVNEQYSVTQVIALPPALQGRFTLFVQADATDVVFEHTNARSNVGQQSPVDVVRIPYADLAVDAVNVQALDVGLGFRNGAPVRISWIVSNVSPNGIGPTNEASWSDRIYISASAGGQNLRQIGSLTHFGALGLRDSYTASVELTLPIDTPAGPQYLYVGTSGPFEFVYTDNNTKRSDPIQVTFVAPPTGDLFVETVTGPSAIFDGDQIDVSWTVRNIDAAGDPVSGSWLDAIYLAPNGNFSQAIPIASFRQAQVLEAGRSYTRTERVNVPIHLQGVYQLFVRTDDTNAANGGEVREDNEANNLAFAAASVVVSLRPRPNLQVTQSIVPLEVTSGGVIDIEFTATNTGPAATPTGGSRWVDYVYLSNNNQPGGILLGTLQNGSALEPGAAYTTRAAFTIQREAAGEYFIVIVADGGQQVDEFQGRNAQNQVIGENDNARAAPLFVDVTPVPPPDLVVQSVNAPLDAFDGNTITVRYRVANLGAGVTRPAGWTDSIWLVPEANRRPGKLGDIYLGAAGHSGALPVGEFYEATANVNIPLLDRGGLYYVMVWADSSDGVFELAFDENLNPAIPNDLESSNLKATPITVIPTPPADLEVTDVQAPATARGGSEVTLSYTVANKGSARTDVDRWAELIYVSTDLTLNNATLVFGLPHFGTLEVGQSYTETVTFTLPPSAKGSHLLVETNADPNRLLTQEDSLLAQIAGIVERAEDRLGKPLAEVRGVDLGNLSRSDLTRILTGDGQAGPKLVFERGLTANNTRAAASTITDIPADLIVTSITVPATSFSGEPIDVAWTVQNQGVNAVWSGTQRWTDHIFISPDPTFILDRSSYVGSLVHVQTTPLNPGDTYTAGTKVNVPAGVDGKWYVHVFTAVEVGRFGPGLGPPAPGAYPDWPEYFRTSVWEQPDRQNNFRASSPIEVTYREADLRVTDLSIAPTTASSSSLFTVTFTVGNAGTRATRTDTWLDRAYISIDQSLDLYDALLGNFRRKGILAPGEQYTVTGEVQLPDNFSGNFNIIAFADSPFGPPPFGSPPRPYPEAQGPARLGGGGDGMVLEYRDEFNNSTATPIVVTPTNPPDLRVTEVRSPDRVFTGRQFEVTYTVRNAGTGVVPDRQNIWQDYLYLSRDQYLDARGDHFLSFVEHRGALALDGTYTVTLTLNVPRGLIGPYYVMVLADTPDGQRPRGVVFEGGAETNNSSATAVPMLIELPPPSDLQVEAITVPAQALPGQQVSFTWRVTNKGVEPASGRWADAAFLSRDAIWDLGDRLITNQDFAPRTLAPGESYTFTATVQMPVALPDNYRVIVRTDIFDDIFEGENNRNNTTASADTIAVTVPTLQLGVPLSELLSDGEDLLFRVQVPAGETLRVTLDSDNDGLANELYVRYEGMPSSRDFDAAFEGGLQGDQVALVGRTEGGFYYIRVRNFRDPSLGAVPPRFVDAPIKLTALLVPFGITDVTPDTGGDGRYVTMTVRGAKFDPSATLKLIRPQFAEFAPVSYQVVDATRIIATFDLRDAPRGLYDVQVTNPNGSSAIVPYRFLIEGANPLDVTVGLGGPSDIPVSKTGTTPALYQVGLLSLTNVDTPYAHLSFGVPRLPANALLQGQPISGGQFSTGERLRFSTNLAGAPNLSGVPWPELNPVINDGGILIAEGFAFDLHNQGFAAVSFLAEVYPELNAILKENPRFLDELLAFEIEDLAFEFYIFATVTPMTASEYVAYQTTQAASLRAAILADDTAPQALRVAAADEQNFTNLYLTALADTGQLRAEDLPPDVREAPQFTGLVATMAAGLLGHESGAPVLAAGNLTSFFNLLRKWAGDQPEAYGSAAIPDAAQFDLGQGQETRFEAFIIHVGVSDLIEVVQESSTIQDSPLDDLFGLTGERSRLVRLSGPSGFGESNFVPTGLNLPFTVRFEQIADATDAVNEIRILQQLDTDLDPRSFRLSDIHLGNLQLALPDRASFTGEFDFSETLGYVVQITAGVDVESRLATWLIRAIDPDTGLTLRGRNLQTNQPQGLLLPGGSGVVGYTIEASDAAVTGATISSTARVIYNADAPLDSNTHEAVLDALAPTTVVDVRQAGATYTVNWTATDDSLGSGVKEYTVYVSRDGGPFILHVRRTTDTGLVYEGVEDSVTTFLVRAQDNAGNVEPGPEGVLLVPIIPSVNLGALPEAPQTTSSQLPRVQVGDGPSTNPLFTQALLRIPGRQSTTRPSEFARVFEPFTASGFATNIPQSGAGIGPLGIAFTPDDQSVIISGGPGRNSLWRLSLAGGNVLTPLVTLDVPIYDMAFDTNGLLWATTGGGPLVQLDPETGAILQRYGDGVTLGLTVDATRNRLFVATRNGVEIFDIASATFIPFSATRVDGLALAPDGTLWGAAWPNGGEVLRFNQRGRAEIVLELEQEAEGLAFGMPGTPTQDLLFVTHASGGALTIVDLVSLQRTEIAIGGGRGDFIHVNSEGRVFVTQTSQVSVFFPVVAPQVISTTPLPQASVTPIVNRASLTFNIDMLASNASDAASVLNPSNYTLKNTSTGQTLSIGLASYDPSRRTVNLNFESLSPDQYELRVAKTLQSDLGVALVNDFTTQFFVLAEVTDQLVPQFSNTRLNRADGTVSFDVRITNSLSFAVAAPIRIVFAGLAESGAELAGLHGVTDEGRPYVDLNTSSNFVLNAGASLITTITVSNPEMLRLDLRPRVLAGLPTNIRPLFSSTPGTAAKVGEAYQYAVQAGDPDGADVAYTLVQGPVSAAFNAQTGQLTWTPAERDGPAVNFEVRAYDQRGGYSRQAWQVKVEGANLPPSVLPIPEQTVREGQPLTVPIAGFDPDGDSLLFWVDNLPGGASYDPVQQAIVWVPSFDLAGRYPAITVTASDGTAQSSTAFGITVLEVPQPPRLRPVSDQTVREGETLIFQLGLAFSEPFTDVTFGSGSLPLGASLNPITGAFEWTTEYTQHGTYELEFSAASEAAGQSKITVKVEVLNANGPIRSPESVRLSVTEGQPVNVRISAVDPDNPSVLPVFSPNGTRDSLGAVVPLTWKHSVLPAGAIFDEESQTFYWVPQYDQAGTYSITFDVEDDGDGVGAPSKAATLFVIEVRDLNGAPVIASISNQEIASGDNFLIPVNASDPEDRPIRLTITGLPAFARFVDNGDGTGVIQGTTGPGNRGDYVLQVLATDDGNGGLSNPATGELQFVLSVNSDNETPVLSFIGDRVAVIDHEMVVRILVSDLDEDALTFAATGLPQGATLEPTASYGLAELRWKPTAADVGAHTITVRVTDSGNGDAARAQSASQTFNVMVRAANQSPTAVVNPDVQLIERQRLDLPLAATDPDGDALTWRSPNLPRGATLNPRTGIFSWEPDYLAAGTYAIQFIASDGNREVSQTLTVKVNNANTAPRFVTPGGLLALEGVEFGFTVIASDLDGDPVSYEYVGGLPPGANFDPLTAFFSWTPGFDAAGVHTLRFRASDPQGASIDAAVLLQVIDVNRPPSLSEFSGRVVLVGEPFRFIVPASDPDTGAKLTYGATNLPAGATLNADTGEFVWTPLAVQTGDHNVRFTVTDGDLVVARTLRLVVALRPIPPSVLIDFTPSFPLPFGQSVLIQATASGIADIASVSLSINGQSQQLDAFGRVRYTPTGPGQYS